MIIIPSITIRKINLKFKKPSHAQIILNNRDKMCFVGVRNKNKVYKKVCNQVENQLRPVFFFLSFNIY